MLLNVRLGDLSLTKRDLQRESQRHEVLKRVIAYMLIGDGLWTDQRFNRNLGARRENHCHLKMVFFCGVEVL